MNLEILQNKIPKEIGRNLEFRMNLHEFLAKDSGAQKEYVSLCLSNPVIAYDTLFWTLDGRRAPGMRNLPFILRPQQELVVNTLKKGMDTGEDVGVNKSKEEGATELATKFLSLLTLFVPESNFLVGSRTEDLVDKTGEPSTLFAKIDSVFDKLPMWLRSKLHIERTFKHLKNLDISSTIDGEATSENFGVGKRATGVMLDEFGLIEKRIADEIADKIGDVSNCVIYNSTHWFGTGHTFYKVLQRKNILKVSLPWYLNPEKIHGLYRTPEEGVIELVDEDYYKLNHPGIFQYAEKN